MAKINMCVYCGQEKDITDDHVISKGLFTDSHPVKNPIIAPACLDCNNGFSKDEEFFRNYIVATTFDSSFKSQELFFTKVKNSILRRPKLAKYMSSNAVREDLFTNGGVFLGNKLAFKISDGDWKRIKSILDKFAKGLFYHEFRATMPNNYRIEHTWIYEKTPQVIMDNLDAFGKNVKNWNTDNEKIFVYGYCYVPDSYNSAWIMCFYEKQYVLSFVHDGQAFSQTHKDSI